MTNCALSVLTCNTSRWDLERTLCVFWSSTFRPSLLWRNNFCLMLKILNPRYLPAVAISTRTFELQISPHDLSKIDKVLWTVVFKRIYNIKVYTLNKLGIINFFLDNIVQRLRVLIIKLILSNFGWIVSIVSHLQIKCDLPVWDVPLNDIQTQFFLKSNLFMVLVTAKCTQLQYTKFPPN